MDSGSEIDRSIGNRIRIERESRGWSLTELAERASISRAMVHKVERGESSPTARLLGRLSGAFGVSISTLIARAEGNRERLLRSADQPVWTDPETGYVRRHLSPRYGLPLDLVQVDLPAGERVELPAASYLFLRQMIWVMKGALTFVEGAHRHELGEGDCLELDTPADCIFINQSQAPCTYLVAALSRQTDGIG